MSFEEKIKRKNIKNDEKNMSIWCIYRSESIRDNKHSHRPCMPEYGSKLQTLCVYVSISLGKGVYSQLGNMHWKVDEHLKYLTNFPKRKYSLEI